MGKSFLLIEDANIDLTKLMNEKRISKLAMEHSVDDNVWSPPSYIEGYTQCLHDIIKILKKQSKKG